MPRIFAWPCSMFKDLERKWLYGTLQLYENGLMFLDCSKDKSTPQFKILFPYFSISEIKKASSKFVFSCITLKVSDSSIWFSSFSNRDMVFNTIEHFWKDQLFVSSPAESASTSNKSQQLIQVVYDTQTSLLNAGRALHTQGQQLAHASKTMNALHNDIKVAERLTDDIDSWFGAWRIKTSFKKKDDISKIFASKINIDKIEYIALIAKSSLEIHKEGYIIMKNKTFDFINKQSEILETFMVSEITEINVHSPWDMTIRKRVIGKPDVTLHIISKRLPSIIVTLKNVYKCVLSYDDPPVESKEYDASDEIETYASNKLFDVRNGVNFLSSSNQKTKQHNLCEEDAQEVLSVLKNIKSIAVDVGNELDAQNRQIDVLDSSVDRANAKLKSADWKVRKMT